jgi:DNA replication licensing factor MCM2
MNTDYSDSKENVSAWLQKPEVMQFVRRKFAQFLRNYTDENEQHVYGNRIQEMCQYNKQSIEVNFVHISNKQPTLAIWLAEEPASMLPILNEVAADIVSEVYPDYHRIHSEIFVRIRDLPVEDKLRDLRQVHLNALVKFRGVVTKRSGVYPQYYKMYLRCICGDLKGPTFQATLQEAKQHAGACIRCQRMGPY